MVISMICEQNTARPGNSEKNIPTEPRPPGLLTEQEAIRYLRLDQIGGKRPELALKRYRTRKGGYLLKGVRLCGKTLYRRCDLAAFVESLQRQQDPAEALTTTRGQRRKIGMHE